MVAGAPRDRGGAAGLPRVRPRRRPRRPQRPVRHRLPAGRAAPLGHEWPAFGVLDTARLARQVVLTRDEAPDCKLSTLARLFRATTTPDHRALSDARATVDVLHGLIERVGTQGVHIARGADDVLLAGLAGAAAQAAPRRGRCRTAPASTCSRTRRAGCSTSASRRTCAARVRTYFTASETRTRMAEMVGLAERVRHVPCPTALEAEVRELRLIAEHKPRYNRRSRFPERVLWLKLTVEPFPRLSLVRRLRDDGGDLPRAVLLPVGTPTQAIAAVHEAFPLRQCTARLSPRRADPARARLPGWAAAARRARARESVERLRRARRRRAARDAGDRRDLVAPARGAHRDRLAAAERYEDAAAHRDRLAAFVRTAARMQRLERTRPGARAGRRPAARRRRLGDRRRPARAARRHGGRRPGRRPRPWVQALVATAEVVPAGPGPTPAASAEETECVLRWLDAAGRPAGARRGRLGLPRPRRRDGVAARLQAAYASGAW